jgi:outer membrane protein assembly factor BamD (BamD/ComL family)/peroxiredoxin
LIGTIAIVSLLTLVALLPLVRLPQAPPAPPAPAPDPEKAAFDAAFALKKQQKPAQAAVAFEEIARKYPQSPRIGEALIEAGVGWFGVGRDKLVLNRATEESDQAFAKAMKIFMDLVHDRPTDPSAGRAQYMIGSTHFFLGDLAAAEADYGAVITKFPNDSKYAPKSLERRSAMRRHLLENDLALADLQLYVKDHPKGEDLEGVQKYLQFASLFDKPAPALRVEAWVQGGPVDLEKQKGQVVGIYFFAKWCEKCEKQRTFVLDLERRYAKAGLVLVGVVNHSQKQTVESVKPWLVENDIHFPVLMDANQATAGSFHESTIPDLVLIDKAGKVRWHDNPSQLWDFTLEALLAEDPSAPAPPAKPK